MRVAVIARPDWILNDSNVRHVIVETTRGVHTRCWLAAQGDIPYLVVYGRFGPRRSTAVEIDFALTQEVFSSLGISTVIGTFTAGSVKQDGRAGEIYVPHDLLGFGPHNQYRKREFRNVDMLQPFCASTREMLIRAANRLEMKQFSDVGVYACFHGYPRIETRAELDFYASAGCDIVGQTLDPEATLAREAGCHYAAIAATIDDRPSREQFCRGDVTARGAIDAHIQEGRRKTFEIFLRALPELAGPLDQNCNCGEDGKATEGRNWNFYYQPRFWAEYE